MGSETNETKIITTEQTSTPSPKGLLDATGRGELSATTIARMLGVATVTDLQLLEGKLDLVATRVQTFATKLDKLSAAMSQVPSGSDLERIDVQISSLKTLLREFMTTGKIAAPASENHSAEDTKKAVKILTSRQKGEDVPAKPEGEEG